MSPQENQSLSPSDQKIGFRCMLTSAVFAVIAGQIFAANILWLIALNLGGDEGYIGLLSFFIFSSSAAQIFIVPLAQRVSKKKFIMISISLAYLFTIPIVFIRYISLSWGVGSALIILACCATLRQMGMFMTTPSWMGLLREVTPLETRGKLLGKLRTSWQTAVIVLLVCTGLYLGKQPSWHKFQIVLLIGFAAQILRVLVLAPVVSPPVRRHNKELSWWKMISVPAKDKNYQPYLLYVASYGLALGIAEPFRIVYLVRLGFGQNLALISSSLISLGAVITLILWGKLADKFGNRAVFSLTLAGLAGCNLLWLGVNYLGVFFAMALFLGIGAFNFGNGLVQTRYLFASLKPEFDASYIAMNFLAIQLSVGLGSLLGGQILKVGESLGLHATSGILNNYHPLFIISFLLFLIPFKLRTKLREPSDAPTKEVLTVITQPLRMMTGALLYWPKSAKGGKEK